MFQFDSVKHIPGFSFQPLGHMLASHQNLVLICVAFRHRFVLSPVLSVEDFMNFFFDKGLLLLKRFKQLHPASA